jgi:hypothetical protein
MTEVDKNPRKPRQPKQSPLFVENNESSGVNLIYPTSLLVSESADIFTKSNDELLITPHDDTIIALVPDNNNSADNQNTSHEPEEKTNYKMDTLTQVYVGSLTVVGLYIVYRLINRTR